MHILHSSLPLLLAAGLAAQSVTVPSGATVGPPPTSQWWAYQVFWGSTSGAPDSRSQLIYATSDISVPSAVWNSVSFRRPGKGAGGTSYLGNANPAMTTNATITMSMSPVTYNSPSSSFASNHGSTPITVFTGMVSLPAQPAQNIWPFPWEMPIPFSTPFPYVGAAGNSVVCEILQTGNTGTAPWYLEAYDVDRGGRTNNGNPPFNCKFSNGQANLAIGHNNPYVGGNWLVNYQNNLPPNLVAIGALGATGVGGTWAGLPLPIDLTPFGAPGCTWNADVIITSALQVVGSSNNIYQWPQIPVPNDPGLIGAKFYDQSLFIDPPANAWGVVTGWSSCWIVGSNTGAKAALVSTIQSTGATGSTQPGLGVTAMFN